MPAAYKRIEQALLKSFNDIPIDTAIPVGKIGKPLLPQNRGSGLWLQLSNLRTSSRPITLGKEGEDEHRGIFQIDLNAPKNKGDGEQLDLADKILNYYMAGYATSFDGQKVRWTHHDLSPLIIYEGFQKIAISVYYYSRTTRLVEAKTYGYGIGYGLSYGAV